MSSRTELLKKHPLIVEVSEIKPGVKFKEKLEEFMPPERVEAIMMNVEQLIAHRILYRSNNHVVVGFIVEPREEIQRPVIIYNRGGSNEFGKILPSDVFVKLGRFALWGYVVIASQYSGNDGGEGKDEMGGADVEDVLVLKQILEGYPYADTARIGMFGMGRGGLMTYLALSRVDWLRAAATIGGIANITEQENLRSEMKDFYRIQLGESQEARKVRSAIEWPEAFCKTSPLLLLHGAEDSRVPVQSTIELGKRLQEKQVPQKVVVYDGAEHALGEVRKLADEEMRSWFGMHVMQQEG